MGVKLFTRFRQDSGHSAVIESGSSDSKGCAVVNPTVV